MAVAQQAGLIEDFWAAQFNAAGILLQRRKIKEAQDQLRAPWPLLESDEICSGMKAALLSLGSELAAKQGDLVKAVELQQKVMPYVTGNPFDLAASSLRLAHKYKSVRRIEEACQALDAAERVGRESKAPGEFLFDVVAPWCECEMLMGKWEKAEALLERLSSLPRPKHFVDDVVETLKEQLAGSKEIRRRIEEIGNVPPNEALPTLREANIAAFKPLLTSWKEAIARASGKPTNGLGLSIPYDYWGSGGAVEVLSNLHRFAPHHFSSFVEVHSVSDIRRAIRMFALFSDTLIMLWKGPIKNGRVFSVFPFHDVKGGSGYMFALADAAFESKTSGKWFPAIGNGAYLPEEVCLFLATEALPLLAQGRLVLLPAPAVGCWQAHHGPCENLLVDLTGTSLLLNCNSLVSKFPVAIVPYFEDAPLEAIGDLLGEHAGQTRRLRLALLRKTREIRAHGGTEASNRELRDEIEDAFDEWNDLTRRMGKKHRWRTEEDQLGAGTLHFQKQWWPLFTLSRLGYHWRIDSAGKFKRDASEFQVQKGTPFGNWLMRPYEGRLILAVKKAEQPPTKTSGD